MIIELYILRISHKYTPGWNGQLLFVFDTEKGSFIEQQ